MPARYKNVTRAFLLAPCTFVVHVVLAAYFVATFAWLGCCVSLDKPYFWVILSSYLPLALWGTLCFKAERRIKKNTHKAVDDSRAPTPFGDGTGAEESGTDSARDTDSEKETYFEDDQEAITRHLKGPASKDNSKAERLKRRLIARKHRIALRDAEFGHVIWRLDLKSRTLYTTNGKITSTGVECTGVRNGEVYFRGFWGGEPVGVRLWPVKDENENLLARGRIYCAKYLLGLGREDVTPIYILRRPGHAAAKNGVDKIPV